MSTGRLIDDLATAYAKLIASSLKSFTLPQFDVIFGPAYQGIPLAATTALLLWRDHGIDVAWAYDRYVHRLRGVLVGAPVADKRVLILDDVMTTGTAIRSALSIIATAGGKVVGVVQCLDREEIATGVDINSGPRLSTMDQVAQQINGPILAIVGMRDLMAWLREQGRKKELEMMEACWAEFGVGDQ